MFRFWFRYVFTNRTLIETGASEAVWLKRIRPDYSHYMGVTFEKICTDYLYSRNAKGELPFLFTTIGRWWGTNPQTHEQVEIDIIANEQKDYLIGECKWQNEKLDIGVLDSLREKADIFCKKREHTWFVLFSKSGFTKAVLEEAEKAEDIILVDLEQLLKC